LAKLGNAKKADNKHHHHKTTMGLGLTKFDDHKLFLIWLQFISMLDIRLRDFASFEYNLKQRELKSTGFLKQLQSYMAIDKKTLLRHHGRLNKRSGTRHYGGLR